MAKKATTRKPRGTAAIGTYEEVEDVGNGEQAEDAATETKSSHEPEPAAKATKKKPKAKAEPQSNGNFGVGDIRKAAAFANAVGGLDKAIALLQILKVAKEVQ